MSDPAKVARLSYPEYLALEAKSDARHEYFDGEIYAMAGGTPEHGALAAAVIGELRVALRGRPCRVFTSDVRVRVRDTGMSTYPDVTVVCGQLETAPEDPDAITNPLVLVEILSDSTEAHEGGAKAAHYRRLPSLRELVLVSQTEPHIEIQRRNDRGVWEIHEARMGERLELASLGIALPVATLFENPLLP